jgi:hypothetical protein
LEAAGGDMNTEYDWVKLYKSAILETDWREIEQRIEAAYAGMNARLREFSMNHGGTPEENQTIADALHGLNVLQREVKTWKESKRTG